MTDTPEPVDSTEPTPTPNSSAANEAPPTPSLVQRFWKPAAALVALIVVAAIAYSAGSDDSQVAASEDYTDTGSELDLERCVDLYNENEALSFAVGGLAQTTDTYFQVGYAADYPDRCLIYMGQPERNSFRQILEASDGFPDYPKGSPRYDNPSWNASIDSTPPYHLSLD